jgi:hypothetical protein
MICAERDMQLLNDEQHRQQTCDVMRVLRSRTSPGNLVDAIFVLAKCGVAQLQCSAWNALVEILPGCSDSDGRIARQLCALLETCQALEDNGVQAPTR